ncbi:oxygenase MpaB family protein [Actinomadura oligospora]|uniref:oxygenase MpaB family protein n=1 Tax=Actinomadura oligospora TaxID=111804 RepID=UPI00047D314D|nr:oxygenase MpaB family protein [Actinomadura oligospora]
MSAETAVEQPDISILGPDALLSEYCQDARWGLAVVRATVLEAAHPQIGAALIENSTFVAHPWRRVFNTLLSTQRVLDADTRVRDKEAARLNRLHARIAGVDPKGRPYNAMDPDARAWVVASLFESTVNLSRMSGVTMSAEDMERLYAEFRAFLVLLEGNADHLPATVEEFWPYFEDVIERGLENTEAMRIILFELFGHMPAPPLLRGHPTIWAAGRVMAGPVISEFLKGTLPESIRQRAGLGELPGSHALARGVYMGTGVAARVLPQSWTRTDTMIGLLDPSLSNDGSGSQLLSALRRQQTRAAALIRLLSPISGDSSSSSAGSAARSADRFFAEVLDQTGDGYVSWPDIAAMAREVGSRLDLDEDTEERLFEAYAGWWRELASALDDDGDGRVSRAEYAAAASTMASPALVRVAEVLFDATDADGDQSISAVEHRALFRTAFSRDVETTGQDARYSRSEFVREFLDFMSGRQGSAGYESLLAQA